ncbi:unnamed protein product [Adineta ricciae]|uniref:C3H1-type domain-containing protein n=1 Tax=Adineta ricciae TaxID=249248 RepID=A0A814RPV0_ADIRI|nr:unnamed protein product [Adineta ricciae]
MDDLSKQIAGIILEQDSNDDQSEANGFYETRRASRNVNFARLEKGLLLFIYIHETTKNTLHLETTLWDRRACFNVIKDGNCSKLRDQCRREHEILYRQPNLCMFWYTQSCKHNNCRYSHRFENLSQYHHYIFTDTDNMICKLIRFVRNFAGHYIDSAIEDASDVQELQRELVVLMVHLVHSLSRKRNNSIEHLNLFLEATTIKQMISIEELLQKLEKPYRIPEIFFQSSINFTSHWYKCKSSKCSIDFKQISPEFQTYFNNIFVGYYHGRLRSRGASAAWD